MAARSSAARAQPDQVRSNALKLHQDHTQGLGARRHIQVNQFLDRHTIRQVVAHRVHVIEAVGHHFGLLIGLGFHVLFDAGVQETDIGNAVDDDLAIQLQQQAQHAVRGGMLRAHVQQHGFARRARSETRCFRSSTVTSSISVIILYLHGSR